MIARLPHYCPVCAYKEWGLEELVHMCWEYLDLIRTYTKPKAGLLVVNLSLPNSAYGWCWPLAYLGGHRLLMMRWGTLRISRAYNFCDAALSCTY